MRVPLLRAPLLVLAAAAVAVGCSRPQDPSATQPGAAPSPPPASPSASAASGASSAASSAGAAPSSSSSRPTAQGAPCGGAAVGIECLRFATLDDAFAVVLAADPRILAIGEAHAQKGTEQVASATKRFTDALVPKLAGKASDLLLEAWAGDPRCQKEVKTVATAQAPVKETQAASNPNEYVAMGTKAKELGIQPHLLRPSCDDYAGLADAGADVIPASLSLIKRLTQRDATTLFQRNTAAKNDKMVVTYGGAMHNDLAPSDKLRAYSFGPELMETTGGRYVELDLIVPEYIKATEVWQKLPWYAAWEKEPAPSGQTTLYRLGKASFVLIFAKGSGRAP